MCDDLDPAAMRSPASRPIKPEKESDALRGWRGDLPTETELISSELALLELTYDAELAAAATDLGFPVAAPL
jgi:hypothetical protein